MKRILAVTALIACADQLYAEAPLLSNYLTTVRMGIAPSYLSKRGFITGIAPGLTEFIQPLGENPTFSKSWKVPFQLSAELGHALFEHVEVFAEFMYQHAAGTSHDFPVLFPGENETMWRLNFSAFNAFGGYIGIRRYSQRALHDCLSFFYGVKFGLVHHKSITANPLSIEIPSVATVEAPFEWFRSDTGVSGGLQIGLDSKLCRCVHLFLNAELLSSVGLVPGQPLPLANPIFNVAAITHTGTGALIAFPITLGLRYYF